VTQQQRVFCGGTIYPACDVLRVSTGLHSPHWYLPHNATQRHLLTGTGLSCSSLLGRCCLFFCLFCFFSFFPPRLLYFRVRAHRAQERESDYLLFLTNRRNNLRAMNLHATYPHAMTTPPTPHPRPTQDAVQLLSQEAPASFRAGAAMPVGSVQPHHVSRR
jgi:hypothetical protein